MAYYSPTDDISFTPLTPQAEAELFRRFHKENDIAARDILMKHYLKLVAKLALRMAGRIGIADEEAISAANYGLIQALESRRFDPTRGIRFATYIRKYVTGQVWSAVRDRSKGHPIEADLEKCVYANDATVTGTDSDYLEQRLTGGQTLPVVPYVDKLAASLPTVMEDDLSSVRLGKINAILKKLTPAQRSAIVGFYFKDESFAEIARKKGDGLTREGVRKAHNQGMKKIRKALEKLEVELS